MVGQFEISSQLDIFFEAFHLEHIARINTSFWQVVLLLEVVVLLEELYEVAEGDQPQVRVLQSLVEQQEGFNVLFFGGPEQL